MYRLFYLGFSLFLCLVHLPANATEAPDHPLTFHFYGALDCPPCMAFKRNHLQNVMKTGQIHGFNVAENIISKTKDVAKQGSYGDRDAILRRAAAELPVAYPPLFFISRKKEIISPAISDWRKTLKIITKLSQSSTQ